MLMQAGRESQATVPAAQPVSRARRNGAVPLQKLAGNPVIPFFAMRLRREVGHGLCHHCQW